MLYRLSIALWFVFLAGSISSCSESNATLQPKPSAERFQEGMKALDNGDYEKARQLFEVIVLQDPGSEYADDAQYYLGESYFRSEDYALAALNFNRLRTSFPSSPFYKLALYRAAQSYDKSSLPFERDQKDTRYAIDQYDGFIKLYPGDTLVVEATARKLALRTKLAERDYSVAQMYTKNEDYKAALLYYNRVIDLYPDTEYFQLATLGKGATLRQLDRPAEALDIINHFIEQYPASPVLSQAQKLKSELSH